MILKYMENEKIRLNLVVPWKLVPWKIMQSNANKDGNMKI